MRSLIAALCVAMTCFPVLAADTRKEPSDAQRAQLQQLRIKECNAKAKDMKGDDRKTFMKNCIAGKDAPGPFAAPPAETSTQQDKVAKCNNEAIAMVLKGDERKAFMSNCLKW